MKQHLLQLLVLAVCLIKGSLGIRGDLHLGLAEKEDGKQDTRDRDSYVKSKLSLDREVAGQFQDLDEPRVWSIPEKPKVAFLFLVKTELDYLDLWDKFFSAAPESGFSIYVHRFGLPDASKAAATPMPLAKFGARAVPWVKTGWCALFGVEVAALHAALKDKDNTQFVFVSESTVPLKRFDYVYNQLVKKSPMTSKFCLASKAEQPLAEMEVLEQEAKRACIFKDFLRDINPRTLKHHQWAVLSRAHAAIVVRQALPAIEAFEGSWKQAAPDLKQAAEGCSDEAVPLTALLLDLETQGASTGNVWADFARLGVEQNCLTYVRWRNCFTGTELDLSSPIHDFMTIARNLGSLFSQFAGDFMQSNLKTEMNGFPHAFDHVAEAYLRSMVEQSFMFARKFHRNLNVTMTDGSPSQPLSELLPKLWDEVNEQSSQAKTWRLLESAGRPDPLQM